MKTDAAPGATGIPRSDRRNPPALLRARAWWRDFGRAPRLMGIDVARALAVFGMMAAHFGAASELELLRPETWGALVHGRSSLLFAVLAGVSISLMTGRARAAAESLPRIRLQLLGRGGVIFAIGLLLELLNTPIAVVLTLYGILYIVAVPCVRWSTTRILIVAGAVALVAPVVLAGLYAVLLGPQGPGVTLVLFGTYPITVWFALMLAGLVIGRMRLTEVRTAALLLLIGIALAAVGYGAGSAATAALGGMGDEGSWSSSWSSSSIASASGNGGSAADLGVPSDDIDFSGMVCDDFRDGYITCYPEDGVIPGSDNEGSWDDADPEGGWESYLEQVRGFEPLAGMLDAVVSVQPHSGGSAEIVGSGGFAIAVIGLCLLAARPLRALLLPLAAVGSMPLTVYSLHVISYWVLVGPIGSMPASGELWAWSAIAFVVLATVWSMLIGKGPLEQVAASAARRAAEPRPIGDSGPTPVMTGSRVDT